MRIFRNPVARIGLVQLLNILPAKTFPAAEVNLTQRRSHTASDGESLRKCQPCIVSSAQVTGIDRPKILRAKALNEFGKLNLAARVQRGIGMPAKRARHIRFSVTDEKYLAHAVHTPQK